MLPENVRSAFDNQYSDLKFIFNVSSAEVVTVLENEDKVYCSENLEGLKIGVQRMGGEKCERCWNYFEEDDLRKGEHSTVCFRCIRNLELTRA